MKLKVCGMRNPRNIIQLMEQVNPDFVGFIFYPRSPRYFLSSENPIPNQVPIEKRVGVFVNNSKEEIMNLASVFQLNIIQLHGNESPDLCRELREKHLTVIKAISISEKKDILLTKYYSDSCDYLLFDTKSKSFGGAGKKFNWEILQDFQSERPYFLSGGIDLGDLTEIENLPVLPYSIDINSRFEMEPGLKDIRKISHFKKKLTHDA